MIVYALRRHVFQSSLPQKFRFYYIICLHLSASCALRRIFMHLRKGILCLLLILIIAFAPAMASTTSAQFEAEYGKAMMCLTPLSDSAKYLQNLYSAQAFFARLGATGGVAAYTEGMIKLYSGDLTGASETFFPLIGDSSVAAELDRWALPDCESLYYYAQGRLQESLGMASEAAALYEKMPMAGLFDAVSRLAALKQPMDAAGPLESFAFSQPEQILSVGDQLRLSLVLAPSDASSAGLVWQSISPQIAAVDSFGTVTAVGTGTTIVVVTDGSRTEFCTITVLPEPATEVTAVHLSQNLLELEADGQAQLTAAIEPADASDASLTWDSTDSTVAMVVNGLVVAMGEGRAIITATTSNGIADACVVTIRPATVEVTSISLNTTFINLAPGEDVRLVASVLPADDTDASVTWSSTNPDVASVSNGVVTALSDGSATIIAASSNGITAECEIDVKFVAPSISQYYGGFDVTRSSAYVNKSTSISVEASCAVDGNSNTAWNTNRKGAGEWICLTVRDGGKYSVSALGFLNGYVKNTTVWRKNARIQQLDVYCDGNFVTTLTLGDTWEYQSFELPEAMIGSEFRFVIQSIYSGSSYPDCALSELELLY